MCGIGSLPRGRCQNCGAHTKVLRQRAPGSDLPIGCRPKRRLPMSCAAYSTSSVFSEPTIVSQSSIRLNALLVADVRLGHRLYPTGVRITEAAITRQDHWPTRFKRPILAVLIDCALGHRNKCTPGALLGLHRARIE